jgi:monoamine oxidase
LWTGPRHLRSTIYEAATDHVGGRCWSLRGFFDFRQIGEHGGAFINSEHGRMRRLAAMLGLELEVVNGGDLPGLREVFRLHGSRYSVADADADWGVAYPAFRRAFAAAPWPQTFRRHSEEGARLGRMTPGEWFDDSRYPELQEVGGRSGRFAQLCETDVTAEYGGDWEDQPALNLLFLLAWNDPRHVIPLSGGDERYHVSGGNDQLVHRMVDQLLAETIRQDHVLVALRANGNRTYTCTFRTGLGHRDVAADLVVLALPFSTLREVDLSKAGLSDLKVRAIDELGMGRNAKLHVQVLRRPWAAEGFSGVAYSDPGGFQCTWDDTVAQQPGRTPADSPGILLQFPGGTRHFPPWTGAPHGPAPQEDVARFLAQIEPVFPGTTGVYRGIAWRDWWLADPWHRGAYSYYRLGQHVGFAGYEGVAEGGVHFCGEHTSLPFQGYMEGAVSSGERVAREIARRA